MTALKWSLGTVVLIMASQNALAQQPIGAGGQIQQIPPAPVQQNSIPALPIPQQQAAPVPVAAGTKFAVNSLQEMCIRDRCLGAARLVGPFHVKTPDISL